MVADEAALAAWADAMLRDPARRDAARRGGQSGGGAVRGLPAQTAAMLPALLDRGPDAARPHSGIATGLPPPCSPRSAR